MTRQYYYHLNGQVAYFVPWSYVFNCVVNKGPRWRRRKRLQFHQWRRYKDARIQPRLALFQTAAAHGPGSA